MGLYNWLCRGVDCTNGSVESTLASEALGSDPVIVLWPGLDLSDTMYYRVEAGVLVAK